MLQASIAAARAMMRRTYSERSKHQTPRRARPMPCTLYVPCLLLSSILHKRRSGHGRPCAVHRHDVLRWFEFPLPCRGLAREAQEWPSLGAREGRSMRRVSDLRGGTRRREQRRCAIAYAERRSAASSISASRSAISNGLATIFADASSSSGPASRCSSVWLPVISR